MKMLDKTNKFHELTLPEGISESSAFELMRVAIEGLEDKPVQCDDDMRYRYHVSTAGMVLGEPENFWGESLAEVAWAIACERKEELEKDGADEEDTVLGEIFNKICAAFIQKAALKARRQWATEIIEQATGSPKEGAAQ
jgi:hypothetical protein